MSIPTQEYFLKRVKDHVMEIKHNEGVYRHLSFGRPNSNIDRFDLVTWPGHLSYSGDMGGYVFARTNDMLTYFRDRDPNPDYWSEKLVAIDRDGVDDFDYKKTRKFMIECLTDGVTTEELSDLEADFPEDADMRYHEFMNLANDANIDDAHEYILKNYTYRFMFCCFALPWAIAMYDKETGK